MLSVFSRKKKNIRMDYVALSSRELILWREKAARTVLKVTDLLLRGGAVGYLEIKRLLHESVEKKAHNTTKDKRRVNPVVFKLVMNKSGVLITSDEYRDLRTAYSDEGGFLVDEFLDLVRPSRLLGDREAGILRDMCVAFGDSVDSISCSSAEVALGDLLGALENALAPGDESATVSTLLASALMEVRMTFTPLRYPHGSVPLQDVVEALAAILLNAADAVEPLLCRFATLRLSNPMSTDSASKDSAALGSQWRKTQERGYDYYTDRDNRDEWIRGREEAPAGPMYQRHLPGYQGHIPTYRSKFGRSFHPIEESAPLLTCPKKPQEPVPADRYGSAMELTGNWLNRHNFKLA